MPGAYRIVTRLQDQDDLNVVPAAGNDRYALAWDNATGKFVLPTALKLAASLTFPARQAGRATNIISAFDNGPFFGEWDPVVFMGYNKTYSGGTATAGEPSAMMAIEGYYLLGAGVPSAELYWQLDDLPLSDPHTFRPIFVQANYITGTFLTQYTSGDHGFFNQDQSIKILDLQTAAANFTVGTWIACNASNKGLNICTTLGSPARLVSIYENWGATGQPVVGTFTNSPLSIATNGAEAINITAAQLVGIGGTAGVKLQVFLDDATTNTAPNVTALTHNTSGTAAAGFGLMQLYQLESSTTASQSAAQLKVLWYEATHATRKADMVLTVFDTAEREGLRIRGAGSAPAIGFLGAAPVIRATHIADATGAADVITRANAILVVLENLGLVATS